MWTLASILTLFPLRVFIGSCVFYFQVFPHLKLHVFCLFCALCNVCVSTELRGQLERMNSLLPLSWPIQLSCQACFWPRILSSTLNTHSLTATDAAMHVPFSCSKHAVYWPPCQTRVDHSFKRPLCCWPILISGDCSLTCTLNKIPQYSFS